MVKKKHTLKSTIISSLNQFILYVGYLTYGGKTHDYQLMKNEFDPSQDWFSEMEVWLDSGYQGFDKDYKSSVSHLPIKKPRKSKKNPNTALSEESKIHNKKISKVRIYVENAIARMKKFNVLNHKFRNKSIGFADEMMELCAGIANFKIKFKT